MPGYWGELIVLAVLAAVVVLAMCSIWKSHKAGGHCPGNCASCSGCAHTGACPSCSKESH